MCFKELDYVLEEKLKIILQHTDTQKEIFVWGWRGGGEIIYNLLKVQGGGIECGVIDNTYESADIKIEKPDYLQKVNPNDVIIFLCMKNSEEIEERLEALEFKKNVNYFSMVEQVYGDSRYKLDYMYWLEYRYGLDISVAKNNGDGECHEYMATPWRTVHKIIDSIDVKETDALFDYGMGKGGVVVQLALEEVFQKLAGIEMDNDLYRIACENFEKLKIENVKAICGDARQVTDELDNYNYFFFYNPFSGSVFERVLCNIIHSYERKKRRIRIIYINKACHDLIMASGIFRLEKQIEVKHVDPLVNIYTTEIEER